MKTPKLLILIAALLTVALAQEVFTAKVTMTQAVQLAETGLQAYNNGDYKGFSTNWDQAMLGAIKENTFKSFREGWMKTHGKYLYCYKAELVKGQAAGVIRWEFSCVFEKGKGKYTLAFQQDGEAVVGSRFDDLK